MATRRDSSGRLNMDAVREDDKDEPVVFPLCEENVPHQRPSSKYTAEWVKGLNFPRQDHYRRIWVLVQPRNMLLRESANLHRH